MIKLDAQLVHGTSELFLKSRYDNPQPTPKLHHLMWAECCSDDPYVALAAPRGHAKSTAVTHAYGLTALLFRTRSFALIVSDTEGQAVQFLGDMKAEILENEDLREQFEIKKLVKDTESDIIVEFKDGEQFRIIVKGSEQKVRGLKWRNKRPDLILCDDLENDEIVMNPERREKFRRWFLNALLPCGGDNCIIRVVGTILHLDSMLQRLLNNESWRTLKFAAHGKDFTDILWPEKFNKKRLQAIRSNYEEEGNLEGYAQEYLNNPVADGDTYFRKQDFIEMDAPDFNKSMVYVAAADFAISEKEKADYTVIMVAGIDEDGYIYIVDVRRGRIGSIDIIDELISVQRGYNPEIFTFETEKIDKAIGPFLDRKMRETGQYINIDKVTPSKSKTVRGKSIQAAMKAQSVRFNKEADWYPDLYEELMTITPSGPRGKHDDFFDAFAYIGLTVHKYNEAPTHRELEEEEYEEEMAESYLDEGFCETTGY